MRRSFFDTQALADLRPDGSQPQSGMRFLFPASVTGPVFLVPRGGFRGQRFVGLSVDRNILEPVRPPRRSRDWPLVALGPTFIETWSCGQVDCDVREGITTMSEFGHVAEQGGE